MLTALITDIGYEPVSTSEPEEALCLIRLGRCRLVFASIHLDARDPYDFLSRALRCDPGIHLIWCSFSRLYFFCPFAPSALFVCTVDTIASRPYRDTSNAFRQPSRHAGVTKRHDRTCRRIPPFRSIVKLHRANGGS